jgi:hypothetical protein
MMVASYIIKQHKTVVLQALETHVLPTFTTLLDARRFPPSLQHNAICLCDDMIEHCSPECHKHLRTVAPAIMANIRHEELYMRCAVRVSGREAGGGEGRGVVRACGGGVARSDSAFACALAPWSCVLCSVLAC